MIDIDFKFRPVGQGAFYSGVFKHRNGKQFSFVYDCGTHSSRQYIDQEIEQFVFETEHKQIDILVISHFHDDHINKIANLLTQTGGAKYAILPYLTTDELILAYTDASLSGGDPDTLSFIQNPVNFLTERKVEKIIYIHPDDESGSGDIDNPNIKEINPESPDFDFVLVNELKPHPQNDGNRSVSHFYDTGWLALVGFWEFKFFNKPRNLVTITAFVEEVKTLLGTTSFDFNDLSKYISSHPTTFESDFNRIYSNNFGARQLVNETSIIVFHGPMVNIYGRSKPYRRWMNNRCPGTLLTGDIVFNQACFDDLRRKWVNPKYNIDVGVFQIPHHGAKDYMEHSIFLKYPRVKGWVINFGLGNTHKHPHQDIINMIIDHKISGHIFNNTQVHPLHYGSYYP